MAKIELFNCYLEGFLLRNFLKVNADLRTLVLSGVQGIAGKKPHYTSIFTALVQNRNSQLRKLEWSEIEQDSGVFTGEFWDSFHALVRLEDNRLCEFRSEGNRASKDLILAGSKPESKDFFKKYVQQQTRSLVCVHY